MRMNYYLESRRREIPYLHTLERRKANRIGHILRRNCLLKQVIEGKIEGKERIDGKPRKRT
jgi:hypothetical protein